MPEDGSTTAVSGKGLSCTVRGLKVTERVHLHTLVVVRWPLVGSLNCSVFLAVFFMLAITDSGYPLGYLLNVHALRPGRLLVFAFHPVVTRILFFAGALALSFSRCTVFEFHVVPRRLLCSCFSCFSRAQVCVGSPGYIENVVGSPTGPLLELLVGRLQVRARISGYVSKDLSVLGRWPGREEDRR